MVRTIAILLVVLALYASYRAYTAHEQKLKAESGDFTCQGCDSPEEHARFLKENSGDTSDGDSEHKLTSARVAAEQASEGDTQSAAAAPAPGSPVAAHTTGSSTMIVPGDQPNAYAPVAASAPEVVPTSGAQSTVPAGLPTRDSEPANAPNGTRFAGSGSYQWYRQGNITWRVDTTTGRSCIIYATMEEWRKEIVMSHGCGRTA